MHKQFTLLLSGFLLLSSVSIISAQNRTYSPTTRFGLGEFNYKGFGRNDAMGGTGIGVRTSQHLNNLNPAAYSAIDSLSFFFEVGVRGHTQNIGSTGESQSFSDMNFDYFALGFPLSSKFAFSLGIKPISQTGYHFENIYYTDGEPAQQTALGLGNLTSAYGGLSYKIYPRLSVGIHGSFWFGNIRHTSFGEFLNDNTARQFGQRNEHHVSSLILDLGIQHMITDQLTIGVVFRPKTALSGETSVINASGRGYQLDGNLFPSGGDTISSTLLKWNNNEFELPVSVGFGVSYHIEDKLTLAADYSTQRWGDTNFPDDITETTNTHLSSLGVEFIPNERTGRRYYHRIRYRAGIHYHQDYLKINGYQLNDFGISFGLGLPLRRSNTSVNLGYQFGTRGTSESGQLSETYNRFTLNFTMHEIWFRQRRFD